jgi:hypothetical protein
MNSKDEKLLREFVKKTFVQKMLQEQKKVMLQEQKVRSFVRSLIKEVVEETANTVIYEGKEAANPHPSTGINKLRDAIRKAKPSIKSKFQQLTTSAEQRESFSNHMLAAFVRLFDQLDALNANQEAEAGLDSAEDDLAGLEEPAADIEAPPEEEMADIESDIEGLLENMLRDLDIMIEEEGEEEAEKMDIVSDDLSAEKEDSSDKKMSQVEKDVERKKAQEKEREEFGAGLEGDSTGRNQAFDAFNLVQSYFSDNYLDLDSPDDREMFKKWGLYNLKLLLDSYEEELAPQLDAPEIANPQ